jgi:predicted lipoprotein
MTPLTAGFSPHRTVVAGILLGLLTAPAAFAQPSDQAMLDLTVSISTTLMVSAYADHAAAMDQLVNDVTAYCADPSPEALEQAVDALRAGELSFAGLDAFAHGPANAGYGHARIRFWPDTSGTGARQLRRLLFKAEPAGLDDSAIEQGSVALADLMTLDRLLQPGQAHDDFSCAYASAVAQYQVRITNAAIAAIETELLPLLTSFGADNPRYQNATEVGREAFKNISVATQAVLFKRLDPLLGDGPTAAHHRALEARAAGQAAAMMAARLRAAAHMLAAPGGLATTLASVGLEPLALGLSDRYRALADRLIALPGDLVAYAATDAGWTELKSIRDELATVRSLVETTIARGMGISAGFNATDGD